MGLEAHSQDARPEMAYRSQAWYGAYMAALFEADVARIAQQIRVAEHLIVSREVELFASRDDSERHALNNALLALRALAICRKITPS